MGRQRLGLWVALFCIFSVSSALAEVASISIMQERFISPDYEVTNNKQFFYFQGGIENLEKEKEYDGFQMRVLGQYSAGEPLLNFFNVSQFYYAGNSIIIGRKIENWNFADQYWKLGGFQPLFRWNPLQPEEQGLTGVYVRMVAPSHPVVFTMMASPVFFPDQGPGYEVQDGKFEKSHPYFQAPPTYANVSGQTDTLVYKVVEPSVQSVVMNSSYAAKLEYGDFNSGFAARASYAYKPSNQLNLGFDGAIIPNQSIEIQVNPQINYHRLAALDLQYSFPRVSLGVSAMHEKSTAPKFTDEWTYATYSDAFLLSPFTKLQMTKNWDLTISAIQIQGADPNVQGALGSLSGKLFQPRFPYQEASSLSVNGFIPLKKFRFIRTSLSYTQEVRGQAALVLAKADYQFSVMGSVFAQAQLISVSEDQNQRSLFSDYVNNDLMRAGVKYVF